MKFALGHLFEDDIKAHKEAKKLKAAERKAAREALGPRDPPTHYVFVTASGRKLVTWEQGTFESWRNDCAKNDEGIWETLDYDFSWEKDSPIFGVTSHYAAFEDKILLLPQEVDGRWRKKK